MGKYKSYVDKVGVKLKLQQNITWICQFKECG